MRIAHGRTGSWHLAVLDEANPRKTGIAGFTLSYEIVPFVSLLLLCHRSKNTARRAVKDRTGAFAPESGAEIVGCQRDARRRANRRGNSRRHRPRRAERHLPLRTSKRRHGQIQLVRNLRIRPWNAPGEREPGQIRWARRRRCRRAIPRHRDLSQRYMHQGRGVYGGPKRQRKAIQLAFLTDTQPRHDWVSRIAAWQPVRREESRYWRQGR